MTATETPLTPGVPATIADLFESDEIRWITGWGNRDTKTCLHGALLRPCAIPGDEIMWSTLLTYRGLTTAWNDRQTSVRPVVAELRKQTDPDEAEMVKVFGPNWQAARNICRACAAATNEQRVALRDARDAWAAWDARDAFVATIAEQWITEGTSWDRAAYDRLMGPWLSVFGAPT